MKLLRQLIQEHGHINIAQFMEIAMYDYVNGYYINKLPVGKDADFITAPEVSQLFGEIIGINCVNVWMRMGMPSRFSLVELGPGKGTMMADILRAVKNVEGFKDGFNVHLVERNKQLKEIQEETLKSYKVQWHENILSLPKDVPLIIVANEFFDCLPINQYIKIGDSWHEQVISLMPKLEEFCFATIPALSHFSESLNIEHPNTRHGSRIEICYPAHNIIRQVAEIFKSTQGSLLIIDYGYDIDPKLRKDYNGTLQAVKNHKYHPVLSDIGNVDLTAHVDFNALKQTALANFCNVSEILTQKEFLVKNGIILRAEILKKKASSEQIIEIEAGLDRLTNDQQMGKLFKVMEIFSSHNSPIFLNPILEII